ncbi:MAG: hypothetical protein H6779_02565 [Candidatus Nomurabacteria bacterium]|nr:hypothetical protein [Candidatus Nomurabacteria bacterium]USN87272.1 MAG: hypothetical protein H6779_02565 [Candidatus Nomurabacteria bacterium]
MDLKGAILQISIELEKHQPETFSSTWIYTYAPQAYRYAFKNVRLDTGGIDWDVITGKLDRTYQKRWTRYRYKQAKQYARQSEVDLILKRYRNRLYTFIAQASDEDKKIQDRMIILLVRLSQKGNVLAQAELIKWVTYITNDWLDQYPQMYRWKGYEDEVPDKIKACIRCYRYTGSFLGYLFKTLEYSARGKPPRVSLDDKIFDGNATRIEYAKVDDLVKY